MSGYIAKQSEKKEYPRPNDGEYIAICNRFIDTGTHINSYGNPQASVRIGWELHGDNLTGEGSRYMSSGEHAGKPFTVDRLFNPSLGSPDKRPTSANFWKLGAAARAYADERYDYFDEVRKELLGRHKATGQTNLEGDGVVSILTKEAMSDAWLKRNYGISMKELPAECITEKVSPAIDWEKTGKWMAENNMPLEPTYFVQVKAKPSKALAA
ncbi:hypothetical protein [Bradyrhizobium yuanmingense]|uniref:hypothetical protein n=1 Tax=Bradyrhizobium yuanmingense TaxID=108015 RepID=UPI0023BA1E14|nr:hypothetical protein [Bradyrhizobium yuanmingense]MDF0584733.1 hypothetical protein [Bradyrhizobium yuanmingense]